jgi:type IV secretion system protein VirB5
MKTRLPLAVIALSMASLGTASRAQGIPVIDVANLIQTITQVLNDVTKIENQIQQIQAQQSQLASISGMRNLGNIADSAALKNYVPADARRWRS